MRSFAFIALLVTGGVLSAPLYPPGGPQLTPEELQTLAEFSNDNANISDQALFTRFGVDGDDKSTKQQPPEPTSRKGAAHDLRKTIADAKKKHKEMVKNMKNGDDDKQSVDAVDKILDRIGQHVEKLQDERDRRDKENGVKSSGPLIDFRPTINTDCIGLGISVCDPIRVGGKDGDHIVHNHNTGDDNSVKGDGNKIGGLPPYPMPQQPYPHPYPYPYPGQPYPQQPYPAPYPPYQMPYQPQEEEVDEQAEIDGEYRGKLKDSYGYDGNPWGRHKLGSDGAPSREGDYSGSARHDGSPERNTEPQGYQQDNFQENAESANYNSSRGHGSSRGYDSA